MARTVGIGIQDFEKVIVNNCFYVDKTHFIREWWESLDSVTLITRPRRFGKTLAMSMMERFFSVKYAGQGQVFHNLNIWNEGKYRDLQGTYPVISLSFANIKEKNYETARQKINETLVDLYENNRFLKDSGLLGERELQYFDKISADMDDGTASLALHRLAGYLSRYYGKRVIILLDEYDTPMQEAYVNGYWEDLSAFIRNLLNAAFKTNPCLERAVMTGITRTGKESIFSDLNNLEVVTTTSEKYADAFGFTEQEVFAALDEMGLSGHRGDVKKWYDGFTFGNRSDIYNPWSIANYLDKKKLAAYWVNTSSNALAGNLIREGDKGIKQNFEILLCGGTITAAIDEQIVYSQLPARKDAVWSFLLASGYLRVAGTEFAEGTGRRSYRLSLTNREVRLMFEDLIRDWFAGQGNQHYNDFIRALLLNDVEAMNTYMNKVALATFSYFDTGKNQSEAEPERFYHGFVLGLMVELGEQYWITSNRESGFGRYDVVLEPRGQGGKAMILEFKVHNPKHEKTLPDTAAAALAQIEGQHYAAALMERGIPEERIHRYGFAFRGKEVFIDGA